MTKFCPACGEDVETYEVDRHGSKERCCIHCGMIVEGLAQKKQTGTGGVVIIADDSPMIREILKDVFISKSLTSEVVACTDGAEFLSTFTKLASEERGISLVVLDVTMPILNGVNAAIAMRATEKGLSRQPVPILFFTGQKCDDNFQKILAYCQPAKYINKGVNSTPDQLALRVSQVTSMLLH